MPPGGSFADNWRIADLQDVKPNRFQLQQDDGTTVLRIDSAASGGSLVRPVAIELEASTVLRWRWRVDRVIEKARKDTRQGDDFAARLYVLFDYPPAQLSLYERARLKVARLLYGEAVPAAALCYVWGNASDRIGDSLWNPYTSRVRVIVLRNAASEVGAWVTEARNLAADFRAAFDADLPRVSGLALATDTDQTGESATSWFGDIEITR